MGTPAIELRNITKTFGSIVANKDVSMTVNRGEILSVLGENGSGKTTLMNMISGIYFPDSGEILIDGKEVVIRSPKDAFAYGIGMIHQHFKLINVFTAAENIILGLNDEKFDPKKSIEKIRAISEAYGFEIDPMKRISDMSVSEKQTVEIIKVLYRGADILILDEPTAVLTPQETKKLFAVLRKMKEDGKSIIIITHKLHEVLDLSDKVSVLRKGEYIGTVITKDTNEAELTEMMVGKKVSLDIDRTEPENPTDRLIVSGLNCKNRDGVQILDDVTFTARSGEILGIAGVVGAGRTELISTIFGRDKTLGGKVILDGRDITGLPTKKVLEAGINFVPEDRHYHGIFKIRSISSNTTSALLNGKDVGAVNMDRRRQGEIAQKYVKDFRTKIVSLEDQIGSLSGGNQQKVVIARALSTSPKVVILDEPTRGIDAAARGDVYNIIRQLKDAGVAVLMVSSDMEEVVELADRAVTVFQGRINGEFSREEITQDALTSASFGIAHERKV